MTKNIPGLLLLGAMAFAIAACGDGADDLLGGRGGPVDAVPPSPEGGIEKDPNTCTTRGATHIGYGKKDLAEDRVKAVQGADRGRLKPYSALKTEIKRVTGQSPGSLDAAAGTFGTPQDRFYSEPIASALTVSTSFSVGFEACLGVTKDSPDYAAAPTAESASKVCTTLARKYWSRAADEAEIAACVQMATTDSAAEPDARRRWAYTCATVLTSAGFMTF